MKLVGKVKEAHGLRGEIYVLVFDGDVEALLENLDTFGLGLLPPRGEEPPSDAVTATLTCEKIRVHKQGLIIKPKEFRDRNASEAVLGRGFYVPEEVFGDEDEDGFDLEDLEGFVVTDPCGAPLGKIIGFSSNGVQDLLVLETAAGKEAEVPFVDAFVRDIDFDAAAVVMELPPGLLDLDSVEAEREDDRE